MDGYNYHPANWRNTNRFQDRIIIVQSSTFFSSILGWSYTGSCSHHRLKPRKNLLWERIDRCCVFSIEREYAISFGLIVGWIFQLVFVTPYPPTLPPHLPKIGYYKQLTGSLVYRTIAGGFTDSSRRFNGHKCIRGRCSLFCACFVANRLCSVLTRLYPRPVSRQTAKITQ